MTCLVKQHLTSFFDAIAACCTNHMPEPSPALKLTGLVYVSDDAPGFTRVQTAKAFSYRDASGQPISDADEIARINKLAIPPAYTKVWICPLPNGHLQATGIDARGRKQYRYHADWQAQRNESKFERMQAFGAALPRIRARVARDLSAGKKKNSPVTRTLVLATLVRLLDTTFARVGNDEYARDNGSFGLTTLLNPHAAVRGSTLQLRFRGKSGVMQDLKVNDPQVAAVVRTCQQLPGQTLFQYVDDSGELHAVGSSDVNEYLAQITDAARPRKEGAADDAHFTAKDFRTWHGTVEALELTRLACGASGSASYDAKVILKEVARRLGNTPAVCRKSYIHPAVMQLGSELAKDAEAMASIWSKLVQDKSTKYLYAAEARLLAFLRHHHHNAAKKQPAVRQPAKSAHLSGKPGDAAGRAGKPAPPAEPGLTPKARRPKLQGQPVKPSAPRGQDAAPT